MNFNDVIKKIENSLGSWVLVFILISLYYYSISQEKSLDNFIYIVIGIFAFTSIFYTVIVVSQFTARLARLNNQEERRLIQQIRNLSNEENRNINTRDYKRNSEICTEKSNLYDDLSIVRGSNINRNLLISVFLLLFIMVINIKFLSEIQKIKVYVPILSIIFFWISMYHVIKIIIRFYHAYSNE